MTRRQSGGAGPEGTLPRALSIASVRIADKRAGQGAGPYRGYAGAAALVGLLAAILRIAIEKGVLR